MAEMRRFLLAAAAAILAASWSPAAPAQLCTSDAQCPTTPLGGGRDCVPQTLFGLTMPWGNCAAADACNTGRDCIPQAVCDLGKCARPRGACAFESDCADDERCAAGHCEPNRPAASGGSGIPGTGKRCMPPDGSKPSGWAQDKHGKPLGACPSGTQCSQHGYCAELAR
ncbi:MAG: hypothetical protein IT519_09820 [Burkholderiales bacterium]|jgi:hypothetical protein|nr:hypothetical protein [Burkholderiales bacterium]